MRRALVFSALVGCYSPQLGSGEFRCGSDGACPQGLLCQRGLCVHPEEIAAEPAAPGGRPDMAPAPEGACAGGGIRLDRQVYACQGAFAAGQAASLCGSAYRPCAGTLSEAAATACAGLPGFYAAGGVLSVRLRADGSVVEDARCGDSRAPTPALLGCGALSGPPLPSACQGLRGEVPCGVGTIAGWSCSRGIEDAASQGGGGVLCCKG